MEYIFDVNINDEDYYKAMVFANTKTEIGKKSILRMRIYYSIIIFLCCMMLVLVDGFTTLIKVCIIVNIIIWIITQIIWIPRLKLRTRKMIKDKRNKGEFMYSPVSKVEFDDERICNTTSEKKIEMDYSAIVNISICEDDRVIYIQSNLVIIFILPYRVFVDEKQRQDFIDFIKTKVKNITTY